MKDLVQDLTRIVMMTTTAIALQKDFAVEELQDDVQFCCGKVFG
jgi:hypothetical protein